MPNQDYMDDSHGKEIDLQKTTIKIPGANKPRIGKSTLNLDANKLDINTLTLSNGGGLVSSSAVATTTTSDLKSAFADDQPPVNGLHLLNGGGTESVHTYLARVDVNSKKRHRRIKSNHKSDQNKEDGNCIAR